MCTGARRERFIATSLALVLISSCASIFNFLFQWIAARSLSPAEYGSLGALLALITYMLIPGQAIQLLTARRGAVALERYGAAGFAALHRSILRKVVVLAVGYGVALSVASPWIRDTFRFTSTVEPLLALTVAIVSLFFFVALGVLQAERRFRRFGVSHALLAGGKLVFGGGAAALGAGLRTIAALLIVAPVLIATAQLRKPTATPTGPTDRECEPPELPTGGSLLREGVPIALTFGGFAALLHLDIGFVQHYYGGEGRPHAGLYNAASTLGRAALHFPTAITAVTFAGVSRAAASGRPTRHYLYQSLGIHLALSIAVVVPMAALSPTLLEIYAGDARYASAAGLLRAYLVPMVLLGIVSIFVNYSFALNRRHTGWVVLAGIVVLAALLSRPPAAPVTTGDDLAWIVTRLTWVSAAMVVVLLIGLGKRTSPTPIGQTAPATRSQ